MMEAFLGSAFFVVARKASMSFSTTSAAASPCDTVLAPFFQADGLPFADVLTANDIEQAFADEQVSFGQRANSFWTPALTLWTFLSQVLDGIKSCRAAVALHVGPTLEKEAPASWRWHGRPVTLVYGFTASTPDTPENQKAWPQPNT